MPNALPFTMRFIDMKGPGGPEVMEMAEGPLPAPRAGEVLIRVEAFGINRPDVAQRQGTYPPPPDASPVLGLEVAGEIVALGEGVTEWMIGDRVTALSNGGGYAEYCAVPAGQALPWPKGFDAVRAAALPETFFTVWANLFDMAKLSSGEHVLIHGGSSGIGTTAIQLAKAFGATVSVTVGNQEKAEACLALGADHAINYRLEDFVAVTKADGGCDVILDMVGAAYFDRNLASLKRDGRLVIIAFLGGAVVERANLAPIMLKRLKVTGSTMRPRTAEEKRAIRDSLGANVWPLIEHGRVGPVIHSIISADDILKAHEIMESSTHIGKIIGRWA